MSNAFITRAPASAGISWTLPTNAGPDARPLEFLRELAPTARTAVEHAFHARAGLLLGVGFGLDTGDTRRLRGVLELVIGEVERVHGGKFCRRENRFSIQYFDVGNAVWIDPV
jgi:hypothetical protein